MKEFDLPPAPHQVIAEFAHRSVIPNVRRVMKQSETHRIPRREIDYQLDSAFHVIDQMLDAWPKEKEGHHS